MPTKAQRPVADVLGQELKQVPWQVSSAGPGSTEEEEEEEEEEAGALPKN